MDRNIEIVPAIKRIELKHVGCWNELSMEFVPGLNIITEDYPGSGKSAILWAIVRAVQPLARNDYQLTPSVGYQAGGISIEFMYQSISVRVAGPVDVPMVCAANESSVGYNMKLLRTCIASVPQGSAILLNEEVTSLLMSYDSAGTVKLLSKAACQVLCIFGHYVDLSLFRQARIYACCRESVESSGRRIRLHQTGIQNETEEHKTT